MADELSVRFIGAPVEVLHDKPPALEKRPGPPDGFVWEGRTYRVAAVLSEWHDYRQRGKSETFYIRERGSFRAKKAQRQGTWGVGRDVYQVRTETGEVFELYYDRAPRGPEHGKGDWFLYRQILNDE